MNAATAVGIFLRQWFWPAPDRVREAGVARREIRLDDQPWLIFEFLRSGNPEAVVVRDSTGEDLVGFGVSCPAGRLRLAFAESFRLFRGCGGEDMTDFELTFTADGHPEQLKVHEQGLGLDQRSTIRFDRDRTGEVVAETNSDWTLPVTIERDRVGRPLRRRHGGGTRSAAAWWRPVAAAGMGMLVGLGLREAPPRRASEPSPPQGVGEQVLTWSGDGGRPATYHLVLADHREVIILPRHTRCTDHDTPFASRPLDRSKVT